MATAKQDQAPALEPRISISTPYPYKFLGELRERFLQGYVIDEHGYILLNAPYQFMVEMVLPESVEAVQ